MKKYVLDIKNLTFVNVVGLLVSHIKFLVITPFLVAILAAIISLQMPNVYSSEATILPVGAQNKGGGVSAAGRVMQQFGIGGGMASGGDDSENIGILLNSKRLARMVLKDLPHLNGYFFPDEWNEKLKTWKKGIIPPNQQLILKNLMSSVKIVEDINVATIGIVVELTDPKLVKEVADAYMKNLRLLLNEKNMIMVNKSLKYISKQLSNYKKAYLNEGKVLSDFIVLGDISSRSKLTVDVDSTDVTIKKSFKEGSSSVVDDIPVDVYLNYLSSRRKILEGVILSLENQYQMKVLESQKEELGFYVVDDPEVPYQKTRPVRSKIVLISAAVTFCLGVVLVLLLEFYKSNEELQDIMRSALKKQN